MVQKQAKELPVFKGYTVDRRLEEFRKFEFGVGMKTVPFESKAGRTLLSKMARSTRPCCPVCGEKLDHLIAFSPETVFYNVSLVSNGELDWEQNSDEPDSTGNPEYHCPECDVFLGKGSSDLVVEFLKGEV